MFQLLWFNVNAVNFLRAVLPYMAYRGCATGQGMFIYIPFLNRVYNFVRVCPNHKQDEIFWFPKYTKAMTKPCICSIAIANKWFKNKTACILSFLLNKGIKIKGVVLNRVCILRFFLS